MRGFHQVSKREKTVDLKPRGRRLDHISKQLEVLQKYSAPSVSYFQLFSRCLEKVVKHGLLCLISYIRPIHVFLDSQKLQKTNFLLLYYCAFGEILLLVLFYICHLKTYSIYNTTLDKKRKPSEATGLQDTEELTEE